MPDKFYCTIFGGKVTMWSPKYTGETCHPLYESDHAALCDERYSEEYETFPNTMELMKTLR